MAHTEGAEGGVGVGYVPLVEPLEAASAVPGPAAEVGDLTPRPASPMLEAVKTMVEKECRDLTPETQVAFATALTQELEKRVTISIDDMDGGQKLGLAGEIARASREPGSTPEAMAKAAVTEFIEVERGEGNEIAKGATAPAKAAAGKGAESQPLLDEHGSPAAEASVSVGEGGSKSGGWLSRMGAALKSGGKAAVDEGYQPVGEEAAVAPQPSASSHVTKGKNGALSQPLLDGGEASVSSHLTTNLGEEGPAKGWIATLKAKFSRSESEPAMEGYQLMDAPAMDAPVPSRGEKVMAAMGRAWDTTKGAVGAAWDATRDFATDTVAPAMGRAWDTTREVAGAAWEATRDFATEKVAPAMGRAWDATRGAVVSAFSQEKAAAGHQGGGVEVDPTKSVHGKLDAQGRWDGGYGAIDERSSPSAGRVDLSQCTTYDQAEKATQKSGGQKFTLASSTVGKDGNGEKVWDDPRYPADQSKSKFAAMDKEEYAAAREAHQVTYRVEGGKTVEVIAGESSQFVANVNKTTVMKEAEGVDAVAKFGEVKATTKPRSEAPSVAEAVAVAVEVATPTRDATVAVSATKPAALGVEAVAVVASVESDRAVMAAPPPSPPARAEADLLDLSGTPAPAPVPAAVPAAAVSKPDIFDGVPLTDVGVLPPAAVSVPVTEAAVAVVAAPKKTGVDALEADVAAVATKLGGSLIPAAAPAPEPVKMTMNEARGIVAETPVESLSVRQKIDAIEAVQAGRSSSIVQSMMNTGSATVGTGDPARVASPSGTAVSADKAAAQQAAKATGVV